MTTISQKPTLASGNITSIVGMTLGIAPFAGLIVSIVGLVRSFREHTHPGFAYIGIFLGLVSTAAAVAVVVFMMYVTSLPGFEELSGSSPRELEAWFKAAVAG